MPIKRRVGRVGLWVPVRVEGHDAGSGKPWEELTRSLDASTHGVAFVVKHPVLVGQVLHLALPLPAHLRSYDKAAQSYKTYGIVVSISKVGAGSRIGAAFLGKEAPPGYAESPGGRFDQDRKDRRKGTRGQLLLKVHLRFDMPGGKTQRETTLLEDFSAGGAKVQSKLDARVGQTLEIDESEGVFTARAEVRGSFVGPDGIRRLHLRFLPPPGR
jgi:hypothetical protein